MAEAWDGAITLWNEVIGGTGGLIVRTRFGVSGSGSGGGFVRVAISPRLHSIGETFG